MYSYIIYFMEREIVSSSYSVRDVENNRPEDFTNEFKITDESRNTIIAVK